MSAFLHSESGWDNAPTVSSRPSVDSLPIPRKHLPISASYDSLPLPHDSMPGPNASSLRSQSTDVEVEAREEQHRYILNRLQEIQFQRQVSQAEDAFEEVHHHQQENEDDIAAAREQQRIAYWQQKSEELRLTLPTDDDSDDEQAEKHTLDTAGTTRMPSTSSPSRTLTDTNCPETGGEEKSTNTVASSCRSINGANELLHGIDVDNLPNHAILPSLLNMNMSSPQCVPVRVPLAAIPNAPLGSVRSSFSTSSLSQQRLATIQPYQCLQHLPMSLKNVVQSAPTEPRSVYQSCQSSCVAHASAPVVSSNGRGIVFRSRSSSQCFSLKGASMAQHMCLSIQHSLFSLQNRDAELSRQLVRLHNDMQMLTESQAKNIGKMIAKIAVLKAENLRLRRESLVKRMDEARRQCVHVA